MTDAVVLRDLSAHAPADAEEDAWLLRLSQHLDTDEHVLHVTGDSRDDDEDDPALWRDQGGMWRAGRFVGELRFEDRELRIEPRLGIDVIGSWLAFALNLAVVPQSATRAYDGPLIAQVVDRLWSAAVADAGRHGGPRIRRDSRHDAHHVRGRIDVPGTARHRAARRPLVATKRTDRDLDNPVARVLVLADRELRGLLRTKTAPGWRPAATEELLAQLRGVVGGRPAIPDARALGRVRYSPITRRFSHVAHLSYEIARHRGHLNSASASDVAGVLIDVAELWELFLLHCARRACGRANVAHGTAESDSAHLLHSLAHPGAHLGRLKPDIMVTAPNGSLRAVVDAKYKRLRSWRGSPSGVDRGDLYQLTSYLAGHDASLGILAYPPHDEDEARAERRGPWALRSGQEVRFVRVPAEEAEAVRWFASLAAEA